MPMALKHPTDPFAFALLQWPALIGVLELPHSPWGWMGIGLLSLWILALQSAAFRGKYAIRPDFGFLILCPFLMFAGVGVASALSHRE